MSAQTVGIHQPILAYLLTPLSFDHFAAAPIPACNVADARSQVLEEEDRGQVVSSSLDCYIYHGTFVMAWCDVGHSIMLLTKIT